MAKRLKGRYGYPAHEPFRVTLHPDRLRQPGRWQKARRIFMCSMGDLFHNDVPFSFIERIWQIMCGSGAHTFLVLTKRPERMAEFIAWCGKSVVSNIHLGVTVENQQRADERIPILLNTPAAVRFVSVEPMLSGIDLDRALWTHMADKGGPYVEGVALNGVICGPENGPRARPMDLDWARSLRDQCVSAGVSFYFKGGELDGKTWHEFPEVKHG